eukprot:12406972-Karenia_brevis.AAC.1
MDLLQSKGKGKGNNTGGHVSDHEAPVIDGACNNVDNGSNVDHSWDMVEAGNNGAGAGDTGDDGHNGGNGNNGADGHNGDNEAGNNGADGHNRDNEAGNNGAGNGGMVVV